MSVTSLSPDPSPESSSQPIARRIAGIAALFACALAVDPARIVPDVTALSQINTGIALHALIIPALAAIGLWLGYTQQNHSGYLRAHAGGRSY